MTRALIGGLAVVSASFFGAGTPTNWHQCNDKSTARCGFVVAPLDGTGRKTGSVRLYTQVLKTTGESKGTLFLFAGGPGQAAASLFDLAGPGKIIQQVFPGYDLVAFDNRGTGRSGALSCPALDHSLGVTPDEGARLFGACGRRIGAHRVFYSTTADAEDTDAVRRALGIDRIALYGVSYGTRQALAYALAHPGNVSRLVLDSVVAVDSSESLRLPTIKAVPHAFGVICGVSRCRSVSRDPAGDLARLANELEQKPLVGTVTALKGKTRHVRVDGVRVLELAVDSDLNRGVAAELPAAVAAALAGKPTPLERLAALEDVWAVQTGVNGAVFAATVCADSAFPWAPETPVARRHAALVAAVAALSPAATAPFGSWSVQTGNAKACEQWPEPSGAVEVGKGRLPNIPVLVLSGERDTRTPSTNARAVAAEFPKSTLLIVRGAGHSILFGTLCGPRYVLDWWTEKKLPACPRQPLALAPIGPFPEPTDGSSPRLTLAAVLSTIREAEGSALVTLGVNKTLAGLRSGTLAPSGKGGFSEFHLARYSDAAGVELTGSIEYFAPFSDWSGSLRVVAARGVSGRLVIISGKVSGTLGGKRISAKLDTG